jgi:hypothetical protein
MSQPQANRPLPRFLVVLASLALGFHLFAIVILVLSAQSGPWPTAFGSSPALGPHFAGTINNNVTMRYYLEPLRMTHNYHFESNNTDVPQIYFEARLKDRDGNPVATVKYPEERANFWVRHRQSLLAQGLGGDQPVQAPRVERLPSPKVKIWHLLEEKARDKLFDAQSEDVATYRLASVFEHHLKDVLRDRPASRPNEWALLVAKSYMRHLCREHGAASGELIRVSRGPVPPEALLLPEPPPGTYTKMIANFGEFRVDRDDFVVEEVRLEK